MGYQVTFAPTKEQFEEKMKEHFCSTKREEMDELIEKSKLTLAVYCMEQHSSSDINAVISFIQTYLRMIKISVITKQYNHLRELYEQEGKFWYCGWEFSKEDGFESDDECKVGSVVIKELIKLACLVNSGDYFAESTIFHTKFEKIMEIIDDFESMCCTDAIKGIINEFSEYKVGDDYSDLVNKDSE